MSYTNPVLLKALLTSLVEEVGVAPKDITVENYLHEAGLVGNAPSGTSYTDSRGHTVTNLGVHEHWNNSADKLYSRNLGKDEGIELVSILK